MKYHVNPKTGVPNVCYATQGKCPYGGPDSHYSSYEEAEAKAYEFMEKQFPIVEEKGYDFSEEEEYRILQENESDLEEDIDYTLATEEAYSYLDDMEDEEVIEELETTTNVELLGAVLDRRILLEGDNDDNKYIEAVIGNPNFPPRIKNDMLKYPEDYSNHFIANVIKNQDFTENELFDLAQRVDNFELQGSIMASHNISTQTIIMNVGRDGRQECDELALWFYKNPNTPMEIKRTLQTRFFHYKEQLRQERMRGVR